MEFLKERIINIRVTFFCFAGIMTGIICSFLFLASLITLTTAIIVSLLITLILISFFFYAIKTEKHNLKYRHREKVSKLTNVSVVCFLLCFVVGAIIVSVPMQKISALKFYTGDVLVSGDVCDYVVDKSSYKKFVLDNCKINDSKKIDDTSFKIIVYTSSFADIHLGDKITFVSSLDRYTLVSGDGFVKLTQNIGYSCFVDYSNIQCNTGKASLKDTIKNEVRETLDDNLSQDNANISYGILFGEKQGLNQDITQAFSYAGISHILAVSGLHIGVLFALIYKSLNKMKANRWVSFVLLGVFLAFYTYLCDFTPSVCRASIMAILLALCDVFAIEYDSISSLSIAGLIILLINPMCLFMTSFQLSFLCIFAIITFAPFLTRLLKKIKMPKVIAEGFAISIATNFVILPICLNVFDKVSVWGVLTNILVLPIFSVAYVILFICVICATLFGAVGFVLVLPDMFLHLIKLIADFTAGMPIGIFTAFKISYWFLFVIAILCMLIHFLMVKKKYKCIISGILIVAGVVVFVLGVTPKVYNDKNLILNYSSNDRVVFYIEDNNVTMIGSDIEYYALSKRMKDLKINHIDSIIAYDLQLNTIDNIEKIIDTYKVENVYVHSKYNYSALKDRFEIVEFDSGFVKVGDLELSFFDNTYNKSYYMEIAGIGKLLNVHSESIIVNNELNLIYKDLDYLIVPYLFGDEILDSFSACKIICNDYTKNTREDLINLKLYDKIILNGV